MEVYNAANRVSHIPELLDLIVQELDALPDLATAARVSTSFHPPSIQKLWSGNGLHLYRGCVAFDHLVHLLPNYVVQSSDEFAPDWLRFRHYSVHVRALKIKTPSYSLDFFSVFNNTSANLFPRLCKIVFPEEAMRSHSHAGWIMPMVPTLKVLEVDEPNYFPTQTGTLGELATFCQNLPRCTPQLQRLILPATSMESLIAHAEGCLSIIQHSLESLTHLRELGWKSDGDIPEKVIKLIGAHPHLTKVRLERVDQEVGDPGDSWRSFNSLVELELVGTDAGMESLMKRLARPELLTSATLLYTRVTRRDPESLTLSLLCQAVNLTHLSLIFTPGTVPWPEFRLDRLEPITNCKKITSFKLSSTLPIKGLRDDAVSAMGDYWHDLEEISISVAVPDGGRSSHLPSLIGLGAMASTCNRLRSVSMTIIVNCCDYFLTGGDNMESCSDKSRTLERLDLQRSIWGDYWECKDHPHPQATAQILRQMWPALKAKNVHTNPHGYDTKRGLLFERWQ